tara:strand:- start:4 stop:288 length:285 start_codon:yes stop_codon:yes gene_type:complete
MTANGLGPWWFPATWRLWLTKQTRRYFNEANWDLHDEGYSLKTYSRLTCDWRFYKAMWRDSQKQAGWLWFWAHLFSISCFLIVRVFGWISWKST